MAVNSTAIVVQSSSSSNEPWNNITIPETAQLPHLMVKNWIENNTITSSLYGFSTSDNGSYQCNVSDDGSSGVILPLVLTGKYERVT